jgi:Zn-dependent peptidase ImmA (M78 family)
LELKNNIKFSTFERYSEITKIPIEDLTSAERLKDGFTVKHDRGFLILYDSNAEKWYPQRLRFSLAHELGHIYLGHDSDGYTEEIEANNFASHLLAPDAVLERVLRRFDSAEIEATRNTFGLSWEAAEIKVNNVANKVRFFGLGYTDRDIELVRRYSALPKQQPYELQNGDCSKSTVVVYDY